jgi:hypothetical protein
LTAFFKEQMRQQPRLPQKHFLNVVSDAADMDVLVITGMRDEAPTATLSHLVPNSRLLDIRVTASENISIMVVAGFPIHCGRELLYHRGFGGISIQFPLVFDGV